jgi:hypothetical protein
MKKYLLLTFILLLLSLPAGLVCAMQNKGSFELEIVKADMKEAGPQYVAALAQYPDASPKVYALYGHTPELQEVFRKYGHNQIVPIVEKCLEEGDRLLELETQLDQLINSVFNKKLEVSSVDPVECGWKAIVLAHGTGNSFLGEYDIDNGMARLKPSKAALAIFGRYMASGLQQIEIRFVRGESPILKEWGLAGLDIISIGLAGKVVATAVKSSIARVARPTLASQLTTARAGMVVFGKAYASNIARNLAKYATIGGVAYLALYHPGVITGAGGVIADALGVSPLVVQTLVWGVIVFVPVWILATLLLFVRPVLRLLIFPIARLLSSY